MTIPGSELPGHRPRIPPSLCFGMAAQFAVGGAVIPFITLLFRDRGLDFRQISLIFTASSATLLVFPFFWGMLADRVIPLNRLFVVLSLISSGSLAYLRTQSGFTGLLLGYTCYVACFNPALYLINALSFHHLRNPRDQFGRVRAWGSLGWIVPFLPISIWLAHRSNSDLSFVLDLGMACSVVMMVVSFWLPHTPPGAPIRHGRFARPADRGDASAFHRSSYGRAIRALMTDRNYLLLLVSMFLMAGSFSLLTYYSPPLLEEVGVPRPWIGPVQAVGVVFEIILFQWQPALLRRWNYAAVILAGCLALTIRHALCGTISNAWVVSGSYLFAGVVIVFYNQGVSILVNSMAAVQVRATAQTLLLLCGQGMGPLFANAVTGRLAPWTQTSLRPVFLFAATLAGLAACLIAFRVRRLNQAARG